MVGFGDKLRALVVRDWIDHYLDYDGLKDTIYRDTHDVASNPWILRPFDGILKSDPTSEKARLLGKQGSTFADYFTFLVEGVNEFFETKLEELKHRLKTKEDMAAGIINVPKSDEAKRLFVLLFKDLQSLESFQMVNYTACRKILKKHDKMCDKSLAAEMMSWIEELSFYQTDLTDIRKRTELVYSDVFCNGDLVYARHQLTVEFANIRPGSWRMFHTGLRVGFVIVLSLWMFYSVWEENESGQALWVNNVFNLYKAVGLILLWLWLWGLQLYICHRYKINYLMVFKFMRGVTMSHLEVWEETSWISIVYFVNFLLYYRVVRSEVNGGLNGAVRWLPLSLFVFCVYKALFPWTSRKWMWRCFYRIITAPFHPVSFLDSYACNVLGSLVGALSQLSYAACFYASWQWWYNDMISGPDHVYCFFTHGYQRYADVTLHVLPSWLRFIQNWRRYRDTHKRHPHVTNALKYALSLGVTAFGITHASWKKSGSIGVYKGLYLLVYVTASLCQWAWDVTMDWGLGDRRHGGLRERLMFRNRWVYYFGIVFDLVFRLLWATSLIPWEHGGFIHLSDLMKLLLAVGEIFRRTLWSIFRLEKEHASNPAAYRLMPTVPTRAPPSKQERLARAQSSAAAAATLSRRGHNTIMVGGSNGDNNPTRRSDNFPWLRASSRQQQQQQQQQQLLQQYQPLRNSGGGAYGDVVGGASSPLLSPPPGGNGYGIDFIDPLISSSSSSATNNIINTSGGNNNNDDNSSSGDTKAMLVLIAHQQQQQQQEEAEAAAAAGRAESGESASSSMIRRNERELRHVQMELVGLLLLVVVVIMMAVFTKYFWEES